MLINLDISEFVFWWSFAVNLERELIWMCGSHQSCKQQYQRPSKPAPPAQAKIWMCAARVEQNGVHVMWRGAARSKQTTESHVFAAQSPGGIETKENLISDRCFTQEPPRGRSWQCYFKTFCKKWGVAVTSKSPTTCQRASNLWVFIYSSICVCLHIS